MCYDFAPFMKFSTLDGRLKAALQEDGAYHDVTTARLPGFRQKRARGVLLAKSAGVFAGGFLVERIFRLLNGRPRVSRLIPDGNRVEKGSILGRVEAQTGALLAGERVLLNLLCHLSGVATLTRRYVEAVRNSAVAILDTRKTIPLWRDLERWAVQSGGGSNHRFSLSDAVLVKDNHRAYLKAMGWPVPQAYGPSDGWRKGLRFVALEATTIPEVWDAVKARADIILLDNMRPDRLKEAILFVKAARKATGSSFPLVEVSGGITPRSAARYAKLGVDRISVGALTHSAPALDISLEVV